MNEKENSSNKELTYDYDENISEIENKFIDCPDVVRRKITLSGNKRGCFFYIQGLVNTDLIQRDFINNIINFKCFDLNEIKNLENCIPAAGIAYLFTIEDVMNDIVAGNTIFMGDGMNFAVSCELKKFDKRGIQEPVTEKNVRGSHDGFIEDIATNMSLLRRRIKNNNLKFKEYKIGATTHQTLVIAYIDKIANPSLLEVLCDKVSNLSYDGFLGVGYVEQMITDHPHSLFPQYQGTERPDKVEAALLEGRFAILLEGTPVVLIVPVSLYSLLQATDDYNSHWVAGSFIRLLRIVALIIAVFLPGLYIAVLTYHYYIVPLALLVPIAESRTQVPFPPVVEALIMEVVIELLREATIRLPTYIATTVGVVGGLVIGQAAVQANIVSNLMIIVVSVTAIAAFTVPNYDMGIAVRLTRFIVMISGAVLGIVGIIIPFVTIIAHLLILESLGQPYFQPVEPLKLRDLKDTFLRFPFNYLRLRPDIAKPEDKKRGKGNGK
jgi:spore germination protein